MLNQLIIPHIPRERGKNLLLKLGILQKMIESEGYILYCYRNVILIAFCLMIICLGMLQSAFTTASIQISVILDESVYLVNMCMGVFLFAIGIFSIPINIINDRFQGHFGFYFGIILLVFGSWIRILILNSIWYALVGTLLTGLSYSFINAPAKVAILWFGKNERALKMTIMTSMLPIGGIIAFILPSAVIAKDVLVTSTGSPQELTIDQINRGKSGIYSLVLIQNIIITVFGFTSLILWRTKPLTPPSPAQQFFYSQQYCESLGDFFKRRNFLILMISFNLVWGVYATMGSVVSSLTSPFGFTPTDNSYFGIAFIIVGVLCSGIIGALLDRKKNYKITHIFLCIGLAVSVILAYLALTTENTIVVILSNCLIGAFVLPFLPLTFTYSSQLTYPLGPAIMGGILISSSQAFGLVLLFVIQALVQVHVIYAYILLFCLVLVSSLLSFTIKQELLRDKAQNEEKLLT